MSEVASLFTGIEQQNTQYYTKCPKGLCRILPANPLRVWLYLREFINTWMFHIETIARDLGYTPKTVSKYLTVLRKFNLIGDIKYKHKGIIRGSKIYVFEGFDYKLPENNADYKKNVIVRNMTDEEYEEVKAYLHSSTYNHNPFKEVTVENHNPSKPAPGRLPTNKDISKTNTDISLSNNATKQKEAIEYPPCVDLPLFEKFEQHRKEIKRPFSRTAKVRLLNKLEDLHAKGYDITALLNRAIDNGYPSIYDPTSSKNKPVSNSNFKGNQNGTFHGYSKKSPAQERNAEVERVKNEWKEDLQHHQHR